MATAERARGRETPYGAWRRIFEERARSAPPDPDWGRGARLDPEVVRSIQRFQVGEDGDGAILVAKAERAGDPDYTAAVRLFVAEEQGHARILEGLLDAGGAPTIDGHWSDTVFVAARRAMGLRLELMVLMIAEVVALAYYGALGAGSTDPLAAEVGRRLLDDERRHVPFHCDRLRDGLSGLPGPLRAAATGTWRAAVAAAAVIVAADHGRALRRLGGGRARFVRTAWAESAAAAAAMRGRAQ